MKSLMMRNDVSKYDMAVCDMQGRLFEIASKAGYGSRKFIDTFMKSEIAGYLDQKFNFYQWAGEEYIWDELSEMDEKELPKKGRVYDQEIMYWLGYIFRYWHYYTGEASKSICRITPPETARANYLILHTMSPEMAVEAFKEMSAQRLPGTDII